MYKLRKIRLSILVLAAVLLFNVIPTGVLAKEEESIIDLTMIKDQTIIKDQITKVNSEKIAETYVETLEIPLFNDVHAGKSGHWAYKYIQNLSLYNTINGYSDGTFRPGDKITRAHAAVMLVNALGLDHKGKISNFSDVPSGHWAEGHIAIAEEAGIINGYRDGRFGPGDNITRGQIAVMVSNAFNLEQKGAYKNFKDVTNKHWAYKDIEILASNEIINGYGDNNFGPGDLTTRAHFSVILSKAMAKPLKTNQVECRTHILEPDEEGKVFKETTYKNNTRHTIIGLFTGELPKDSILPSMNINLYTIDSGETSPIFPSITYSTTQEILTTFISLAFQISDEKIAAVAYDSSSEETQRQETENIYSDKTPIKANQLPIELEVLEPDSAGDIYIQGQFTNNSSYPINSIMIETLSKDTNRLSYLISSNKVSVGEKSEKFLTEDPVAIETKDVEITNIYIYAENPDGEEIEIYYNAKLNKYVN